MNFVFPHRMRYTEALINEVLRMVTIGAMSIFHSTTEKISNFHGYTLPKNCIVFGNLWEVHHDPGLWGDPENFRPERFLENPDASVYVFSTGEAAYIYICKLFSKELRP